MKYLLALGIIVGLSGVAKAEYVVTVTSGNVVKIVETTITDDGKIESERTVSRATELVSLANRIAEIDGEIKKYENQLVYINALVVDYQKQKDKLQEKTDAVSSAKSVE